MRIPSGSSLRYVTAASMQSTRSVITSVTCCTCAYPARGVSHILILSSLKSELVLLNQFGEKYGAKAKMSLRQINTVNTPLLMWFKAAAPGGGDACVSVSWNRWFNAALALCTQAFWSQYWVSGFIFLQLRLCLTDPDRLGLSGGD